MSRKRIARLMRDQGLQGVCRRKRVTTTVRDPRDRVVPDLVDRDFYASAPDELSVADATYIPTGEGFDLPPICVPRRVRGFGTK